MTDSSTQTAKSWAPAGSENSSSHQDHGRFGSGLAEGAADAATAALDKGKELVDVAGTKALDARDMLVTRIKQNPLSSVGIALGVGVVFAMLRR